RCPYRVWSPSSRRCSYREMSRAARLARLRSALAIPVPARRQSVWTPAARLRTQMQSSSRVSEIHTWQFPPVREVTHSKGAFVESTIAEARQLKREQQVSCEARVRAQPSGAATSTRPVDSSAAKMSVCNHVHRGRKERALGRPLMTG